jgi:hypothetical protein
MDTRMTFFGSLAPTDPNKVSLPPTRPLPAYRQREEPKERAPLEPRVVSGSRRLRAAHLGAL